MVHVISFHADFKASANEIFYKSSHTPFPKNTISVHRCNYKIPLLCDFGC